MENDKTKAQRIEEKVPMERSQFTERQVQYAVKSARDVKMEFSGKLKDYNHMGSLFCHAFAEKDGNGAFFVTVPMISQLDERATIIMAEQILADLKAAKHG